MSAENPNFQSIYLKYRHLVYFTCYRYVQSKELSQDITAEVFTELIERPDKLEKVIKLDAWLAVYTRNKCLKTLQKQKRDRNNLTNFAQEHDLQENRSQLDLDLVQRRELKEEQNKFVQDLHRALDQLKTNHRICLTMHFLREKSYQEIMDVTQFSFRQVDNYLYYGKKKLLRILREMGWNYSDFKTIFNIF